MHGHARLLLMTSLVDLHMHSNGHQNNPGLQKPPSRSYCSVIPLPRAPYSPHRPEDHRLHYRSIPSPPVDQVWLNCQLGIITEGCSLPSLRADFGISQGEHSKLSLHSSHLFLVSGHEHAALHQNKHGLIALLLNGSSEHYPRSKCGDATVKIVQVRTLGLGALSRPQAPQWLLWVGAIAPKKQSKQGCYIYPDCTAQVRKSFQVDQTERRAEAIEP